MYPLFYSVPLTPQQATVDPCLCWRLLDTHRQVWLSLLWGHCSWCAQGFLCALQESVSPLLWKFCNQIPLAFKIKFPGSSQSLCQIPRLGNLLWALELLEPCENFFDIIVLQFVGCLLSSCMVGLMETSSKRIYATSHSS